VRERVLDRVADGDLAGALQAAPAGARPSLSAAYEQAFSGALDEVFVVGIVGNLLAAVLAAVLIRGSDMWSPERVPARRGGGAVAEPAPLRAEP